MRQTLSKEAKVQMGIRIREARDRAGFSQEKLAEVLDKTPQFVSDLERGVTGASLATAIRICEVLHASSDYILLGRKADGSSDTIAEFEYLSEPEKDLINRGIQLFIEAFSYKD